MDALPACLLRDVVQEALGVAVIGIDEGQFVSELKLQSVTHTHTPNSFPDSEVSLSSLGKSGV